jgi:hypothetical protein
MVNDLMEHKNLTVFKQHGFIPKATTGNQVYGYSIFSGKSDKFYVNPETKMWDCKTSGKEGGYQTFLREVYDMTTKNFRGDRISWLKKNRGLQRVTLKHHGIGWNPNNETYLIPVWDSNNDKLWDLRIYNTKNKKLMSSAGANTGLYGWEALQKYEKIWLVEGEWDRMAMWEILYRTDRLKEETVVSVPGAGVFKNEWHALFNNKTVMVCYDADKAKTISGVKRPGAGPAGTMKVMKALSTIAKKLTFVNWPDDVKDGHDIRDQLIHTQDHETAYKLLSGYLKKDCPLEKEFRKEIEEENKTDEELFTGKQVPARTVYRTYKKWLYLPDTTVIDVLYGTIIANRLDGDPLWLFIVAPSGGTKTVFMLSISEAPKIVSTTTMTPHSLVSGANFAGGGDPSLIPMLDGKVLAIKDFTTILNMNQTNREEIFGILRDAYDGKTEKMFGNGVFRSYHSKFGLLAGVTRAIELFAEGATALGERFLRYHIPISGSHRERMKYLRRAMKNADVGKTMEDELRELGTKVLSYNYKDLPEIPDWISERLLVLAQWTSVMRGTVARDTYSKEIVARPFVELGTRLVKQFTKLLLGIGMFRGLEEVGEAEYKIIRDIAIGSIPSDINEITKYMNELNNGDWAQHADISKKTGLPSEACRRKTENLVLLEVLDKDKQGYQQIYKMNDEIKELITEGEIYD